MIWVLLPDKKGRKASYCHGHYIMSGKEMFFMLIQQEHQVCMTGLEKMSLKLTFQCSKMELL